MVLSAPMEQPAHHRRDAILATLDEDREPARGDMPGAAQRLHLLDAQIDRQPDIAAALGRLDRDVMAHASLPDLSIIKQSGPFPSVEAFYRSSLHQFGELLRFTALQPDQAVLDYGCGLGRIALPLAAYLDPSAGRYCGVDTNGACIELNRKRFAPYEQLRFEHVDLFSSMYNPEGGPMTQLDSLDLGDRFDVAFLFSVFTHILAPDCPILLRFLARHLKPGATMLTTWFLLNDEARHAIEAGSAQYRFPFAHGEGVRVNHRKKPEGAVAYEEDTALAHLERCGFEVEKVVYGRWTGTREAAMGQDAIIVRRGDPARTPAPAY